VTNETRFFTSYDLAKVRARSIRHELVSSSNAQLFAVAKRDFHAFDIDILIAYFDITRKLNYFQANHINWNWANLKVILVAHRF